MNKVVEYLKSLPGLEDITGLTLTIKDKTWVGAKYIWVGQYEKSMQACQRGDKKPGEEYRCERYYFLGVMPKFKKKNTCFTHEGQTLYISGYYQEDKQHDLQPLGKTFMLGVWPEKFGNIDDGERYPYDRLPIELTPDPSP